MYRKITVFTCEFVFPSAFGTFGIKSTESLDKNMLLPNGEHITETKTCQISGEEFVVLEKDIEFYKKIAPSIGGKNFPIPTPKLCPQERRRRRLGFYNHKNWYWTDCEVTGKKILSRISPDKGLRVWSIEAWSDRGWDPSTYSLKPDFEKPFFDQVQKLIQITPYQNLLGSSENITNNALYTNHTADISNSYLVTNASWIQDSCYSSDAKNCEKIFDCLSCSHSRESFECIGCSNIYSCKWCLYVHDSTNCLIGRNLRACTDCIGCVNLHHKKNHILNQEVTKEVFEQTKKRLLADTVFRKMIESKFEKLVRSEIHEHCIQTKCENCTGDSLYACADCYECFNSVGSSNLRYCEDIDDSHNLMDVSSYGSKSELMYESVSAGRFSREVYFSAGIGKGQNLWYCFETKKSGNCFGCVNIHYLQNCILNTCYSKNEWESLASKLVDHMQSTGEWGEFFPLSISPYCYNETVAHEYLPLIQDEAESLGAKWKGEDETSAFMGDHYTPKSIDQYDEKSVGADVAKSEIDACLQGILKCSKTGKPYKIIKQELAFYIENNIPLPDVSPEERHLNRLEKRNPRKMLPRTCTKCQIPIQSTLDVESFPHVACKKCYQNEHY